MINKIKDGTWAHLGEKIFTSVSLFLLIKARNSGKLVFDTTAYSISYSEELKSFI